MNQILQIYNKLFCLYGPQGWWPLQELDNTRPISITKSGSLKGYHPGDYSYPKNKDQIFEICLGAILTANTAWTSVDKALANLKCVRALAFDRVKNIEIKQLKECIKPAGYYNQKAIYIREFTKFFNKLGNKIPKRDELLKVKGIGNETADSMLLYAFKQPEFVVDAYTRRIFTHLKIIKENSTYNEIKEIFQKNLPKDIRLCQEYHALLVEHSKRYYSRKPYGANDTVLKRLSCKLTDS
ncbi:endonuclease III domain-containing protein [Candidatus Woesearchaeota archaeon]|nr:endonuclease III domain-containing protein [Candidatus Woesearchaeota archaeon]